MSVPCVFISYSSTRHDLADLTCLKLKEAGINAWIDKSSIKPGTEWRDEIDNGIAHADAIIVILDKESSISSYVTYEWAFALGNGKLVIPIKVDDCKLHPRLNVLQYMDFSGSNRPWDKLIERVKEGYVEKSAANAYVNELAAREANIIKLEHNMTRRNAELEGRAEELDKGKKELDRIMSELSITIRGKKYLPNIKSLDLSAGEGERKLRNDDLKELFHFVCLEKLELRNNRITDLSFLSGLPNLKVLGLHNNRVTNISAINNMSNLVELALSVNEIQDISPLSTLVNLEVLSLSNYTYDITQLRRLSNLKSLSLFGCHIDNLAPLSDLRKLVSLRLAANNITDLNPLAHLCELRNLDLDMNRHLVDISPLAKLKKLKRVVLNHTSITDWSAVAHVDIVVGRED